MAPDTAPRTSAYLTEELVEHGMLGNQALADRMGEPAAVAAVPFDVIRDTAIPMIERVGLAVEIRPMSPEVCTRYVEILEASNLPEGHRAVLVDKLFSDQAVATGISTLLARHFEGEEADVRLALGAAVDTIMDAIEVMDPRSTGEGPIADQAGALIGELASSQVPALATHTSSVSESVSGLCMALFLATFWEEEEEEEDLAPMPELDP